MSHRRMLLALLEYNSTMYEEQVFSFIKCIVNCARSYWWRRLHALYLNSTSCDVTRVLYWKMNSFWPITARAFLWTFCNKKSPQPLMTADNFSSHSRRSVGWKAYVMNLGFYILFLVMLTTMTVLLEDDNKHRNPLLDIPRFTIVVMSLFHLLKEIFQIWDEVR